MNKWTRLAKEENEENDIFEKLEDALEGLRTDPEVVKRWLEDKTKMFFKVEPGDKYALWDDMNGTITLCNEKELIEIVKANLEDMKDESPDNIVKMQKHIDNLSSDNVLQTFKMIKNEWMGMARGWEKFIPEGTKYIVVETDNRVTGGPRALFIKEDAPKDIMFDKEGY